jgi:hypothetical protein
MVFLILSCVKKLHDIWVMLLIKYIPYCLLYLFLLFSNPDMAGHNVQYTLPAMLFKLSLSFVPFLSIPCYALILHNCSCVAHNKVTVAQCCRECPLLCSGTQTASTQCTSSILPDVIDHGTGSHPPECSIYRLALIPCAAENSTAAHVVFGQIQRVIVPIWLPGAVWLGNHAVSTRNFGLALLSRRLTRPLRAFICPWQQSKFQCMNRGVQIRCLAADLA